MWWKRAFGSTNLIVHHCLANIIHQVVKPLRILGVVQELHNIFLSCHWVQSFVDIFQFPSDPARQSSLPILERVGLPRQFIPPRFLLEVILRSRCAQQFNKRSNPGSQGFYRLFVDLRLLGEI